MVVGGKQPADAVDISIMAKTSIRMYLDANLPSDMSFASFRVSSR